MENTTQSKIQDQISHIRDYTDIALNAIDKLINSNISTIGYGYNKPLKKLEDLPEWCLDAENLVEIYNYAKAKEVIKDNRQSMIRQLNEKEEKDSE